MSESRDHIGLLVRNLTKSYSQSRSKGPVFADLNFQVGRSGRLALLGRNGQGKSTLIKILGGVLPASSGKVQWAMTSSWPIGFGGGFQGSLSGYDNIRFLARLYARDYDEILERVDGFAELGSKLKMPVKHYSAGMRARLTFGLSLAIEFDCYLIDELVAVGDARFQDKCNAELFQHRADRAYIMASHDMSLIAQHCDQALVIESGQARMFDDIREAIDVYTWLRSA
ncbi:ABC transporter ATP-binding protein [Brevundimonas sp.]|uniref:ABC transporter ATP-binding protein n=1 Tax=Brevundimonas sp. TaxID=1871086 RepID=UPI00289D488C|nr:ABC transporter ATP-binding protein [Brevundimonas sp.]